MNVQRYIHQPFYRGDIKQEYTEDTAKTVVINAKKETLYTSSLIDFVFEFCDSVTTTLNIFGNYIYWIWDLIVNGGF